MKHFVLISIIALLSQGCMKQAIEGMGFEMKDRTKVEMCSQSVKDSYHSAATTNHDPTLINQFETTFNCDMGEADL